MRIVHIDRQRSWTGQIKRVFELSQGLRRRGHDVALIANPGSQLAERGLADAFEVLQVPMRGWRAYPSVLEIVEFLREKPVDVLHSHGPRDHLYTFLASRLAPVRHLVRTKHNHTRLRSGWLSRLLYEKTSAVITISEFVRQNLLLDKIAPDHVTTLSDAIETKRFAPSEKDPEILALHGLAGVDTIVGSVSSLHKRKGVEELLRAYKLVREKLPDQSMKCVLTGGAWEQWVPLVTELGLTDEVVFPGFQTDVPAYLAILDIYVLPSRQEGLGNSILEAMCMERPVVVSDVGGITEAVTPETGIILSDTSPPKLAEAIHSLVIDPERRRDLAEAGRARVIEHFSFDVVVDRTLEIYERLLAAGDGPQDSRSKRSR